MYKRRKGIDECPFSVETTGEKALIKIIFFCLYPDKTTHSGSLLPLKKISIHAG